MSSRAIRLLTQFKSEALVSKVIQGRYVSPMISKRVAASVRKKAIRERSFGSFKDNIGGWDESWDKTPTISVDSLSANENSTPSMFLFTPNIFSLKPKRGHKRERDLDGRIDKVNKAMETVPVKLDKYKQDILARKPKKDITYLFKRATEVARSKSKSREGQASINAGKGGKGSKDNSKRKK